MVSEWPKPLVSSRSEQTGKREKLGRKSTRNSFSTAARSEDRVRGTLNTLKVLVRAERSKYVKSQLEKNYDNLQEQIREVERLSRLRDHHQPASAAESDDDDNILSEENGSLLVRSRLAIFLENSRQSCGTGTNKWPQICSKLNGGNCDARKIVPIDTGKLEAVDRLPLCTTWMFVNRNERMAKDQSIARRRRIFYESNGKETFFCLDSEEEEKEVVDNGEETKGIRTLSETEEFISRMAILEHGSGRGVLETIADFLHVSVAKVESRFQTEGCGSNMKSSWQPATIHNVSQIFRRSIRNNLHSIGNLQQDVQQGVHKRVLVRTQAKAASSDEETKMSTTLALALDSFDTLFCRRCLVFNCALHPCFEEIVVGVNERQPPCVVAERDQPKPCSLGCRFFVSTFGERLEKHAAAAANLSACASGSEFQGSPSNISCATEAWQANNQGGCGGISEDHLDGRMRTSATRFRELDDDGNEEVLLECELRTISGEIPTLELGVEEFLNSQEKTTRRSIIGESVATKNAKKVLDGFLNIEEARPMGRTVEDAESSFDSMAHKYKRKHPKIPPLDDEIFTSSRSTARGIITTRKDKGDATSELWCSTSGVNALQQFGRSPTKLAKEWNRLEQDLCEKGIQIFGKNSCLIAQNVLKGYKSCREIAEYIRKLDIAAAANVEEGPSADGLSDRGTNLTNVEILPTGRVCRPKFRFGRKKVAPKSALGAIRKRIGREGGLLNHCRQYKPCSCESRLGCGKDCPCVLVDTHCEKYCGCFKVCKNRFRGCQCAKSMCDRRHCPCFAAGRECDPDVCKLCWIECGHSSSQECRNMRILQRKKKRVLLARSDVCTGWGVFTRHILHKNDYIGEYAGELISHSEADRRGRIYDRETSFLFNLNDKLVVDAFRKGNKLKFANHSARKPNCYAKVLLVGGDHRVGIFAKDKIEAGEELLYDYQYEPEIAPLWATGAD